MDDERRLSTTEAILGLTLIAGLLLALVGAYIYRFDEETPVVSSDPNWATTEPAPPPRSAQQPVEQVSYRPVWLAPQNEAPQNDAEQAVTR
jgi:hypothetical protein